jgi:hypothetical protein
MCRSVDKSVFWNVMLCRWISVLGCDALSMGQCSGMWRSVDGSVFWDVRQCRWVSVLECDAVSMGQCFGMWRIVDGLVFWNVMLCRWFSVLRLFEGITQDNNLNNTAVKYSNLAVCALFIAQFLISFTWLRKCFLFHLMEIYILQNSSYQGQAHRNTFIM